MRGLAFAVLRRLLIIIPVLWAVVTLVFLLIHIVPGDPARQLVGENATEQQYQIARGELGLDKPLPSQYADYWRGLVRGEAGARLDVYRNVDFDSVRRDRRHSQGKHHRQPVDA